MCELDAPPRIRVTNFFLLVKAAHSTTKKLEHLVATNPPAIITLARQKLASLVYSASIRYGRSRRFKAMKKDYAKKVLTVLDSMLQACCLQFDGALCRVSGERARPYTVPELATFTELNQRCVERIIHDLKDLKLIQSEKQFKRMFPEGLKVAAVWRVFTKLFWESLGLWSLFVESVKYSCEHGKLKFQNLIKLVGKKKPPDIIREERRRSKQKNQLFLFMCQCEHRKGEKACTGQHKEAEICALCHKFSR